MVKYHYAEKYQAWENDFATTIEGNNAMTTVKALDGNRFAGISHRSQRLAASAGAAMLALCASLSAWGDGAETMRIQSMADTYLLCDGNQLIDTGYYANHTTKVVMEYEIPETNKLNRFLFGNSGDGFPFGMYYQTGLQRFVYGTDSGSTSWKNSTIPCGLKQRFTATLDSKGGTISISSGGVSLYSESMTGTRTHANSETMKIFGSNAGTVCGCDVKLYSFAIYDDGTLVRDFIPYGRGAVTGLLDKCSGKVYTDTKNVSGHPFTIGTDDGYVWSKDSNRACLDTGYTANSQSKVEIDFSLTEADTAKQCVFSTGYGNSTLALYVNGTTNFAWACQDDTTAWNDAATVWHDTGVAADGARWTFAIDVPNRSVALVQGNGTTNYTAVIDAPPAKSASYSLKLFMDATNHTEKVFGINPASVRLYGLKIWDGATLARDYSPRLVDNVPGIYDAVNDVFIKSVSERGLSFGGDIACTSAFGSSGLAGNADAYLEFTGLQSINTGYTPTRNSRLVMDYGVFDRMPSTSSARCFFAANATDSFYLYYNKAASSQFYQYPGGSTASITDCFECRFKLDINLTNKTNTATLTFGDTNITKDFSKLKDSLELESIFIGSLRNGNSRGTFRLYSFAIYEYGSDTPSHFYTPCMIDGVAGLWDSCDKVFKQDVRGAAAFGIGGAGANGGGMTFLEHPQDCIVKKGRTVTLEAYAPGAVGYQWLKNGEVVEGATGRTLEVSWQSRAKADAYQCVSYYSIFGYGVSDAAYVGSAPTGMFIIFR